ncbi:hypothetical protein LUZ60_013949 [Juncus effusus]|nr:hypothetical protein LUZ60_013949 [Juncus effusus]
MAIPNKINLLLLSLLISFIAVSASQVDWVSTSRRLADNEELELGGTPRRVLDDSTGYISYDALMADSVPCSISGASYYNCQPGADANPYSRGCTAITDCRG